VNSLSYIFQHNKFTAFVIVFVTLTVAAALPEAL
jgi:hypothetical protein